MDLTLEQKEVAYEAIIEYLIRVTYLQAQGHLTEDTSRKINGARDLARKLITELNVRINERDALSAGLVELVSEHTRQEVMSASEPTASNPKTILQYFAKQK
jgi:hypothetical protein